MKEDSAPRASTVPAGRSFELFFADVWPWAYRLATMLTQDEALGEEVAQDCLARLYRTWGGIERPEAYLRTSIVNACSNMHRGERVRRLKLPLVASPDRVDFQAEELADVIARLPYRQRAVIVLRYFLALSEAEIAEALDCRPGTVKSLASRALDALRKGLST